MKKLFLSILLLSLSFSVSAQKTLFTDNSPSTKATIERLEKNIPELLESSDVPGMSIALVKNGKLVWTKGFGVKNSETKEPVIQTTIFEAASLSKPVFAYAVLKLVDEGKIDLDVPLNKYLGNNYDVGEDERLNLITARRVLSHTSGFPNWRNRDSKTLPINFTPGDKFSYSGEGFVYLSKVVEKITGMEFEKFIEKEVFKPLEMNESSFIWKNEFLKTKVFNHDGFGKPQGQNADVGVNAAASLHTTAENYAKFVMAILEGKGLKKKTREMMLKEQVFVNKEKSPEVAWGLGLGLELTKDGKTFFHWGDNGFNKSFIVASERSKDAIVFFTNSANGLSFLKEILDEGIGGEHPSIAWLDYERYDSPSRQMLKAIIKDGAEKTLVNYRAERKKDSAEAISERQMNQLGYTLLRAKKITDAIEVFKQNAEDFPESSNVWDSLAEGYMLNGEKESAIKYYKKSLELDPENKNAEDKIKELSSK
jgi:CubicO group peptidase (beta-lactamase class C family)